MTVECEFCNDTKAEPGIEGACVWCEPFDAVGPAQAEQPDLLRDALDHIMRTCVQSRTGTRRLRWIAKRAELALEGRVYVAAEHDLPLDVDNAFRKLQITAKRHKAERNALQLLLNAADEKLSGLSRPARSCGSKWHPDMCACSMKDRGAQRCSECGGADCNGQCAGDDMMGDS